MERLHRKRKVIENVLVIVEEVLRNHRQKCFLLLSLAAYLGERRLGVGVDEDVEVRDLLSRIPERVRHMDRLVRLTDMDCVTNLRMDRNTFGRLCRILRDRMGFGDHRYVIVEEQVAMLLSILAHHKKNRVVGFDFIRSGQTVSHYIHQVLRGVIGLHELFMAKPTPVDEGCDDPH